MLKKYWIKCPICNGKTRVQVFHNTCLLYTSQQADAQAAEPQQPRPVVSFTFSAGFSEVSGEDKARALYAELYKQPFHKKNQMCIRDSSRTTESI